MEKYIMIMESWTEGSEDGISVSNYFDEAEMQAVKSGVLTVIRISDQKRWDAEKGWVELLKW